MNTNKVEYLFEAIANASEIHSVTNCSVCDFYYDENMNGDENNSVIMLETSNDPFVKPIVINITEGALDKATVENDGITFVDTKGNKHTIYLYENKPKKIKCNW